MPKENNIICHCRDNMRAILTKKKVKQNLRMCETKTHKKFKRQKRRCNPKVAARTKMHLVKN